MITEDLFLGDLSLWKQKRITNNPYRVKQLLILSVQMNLNPYTHLFAYDFRIYSN